MRATAFGILAAAGLVFGASVATLAPAQAASAPTGAEMTRLAGTGEYTQSMRQRRAMRARMSAADRRAMRMNNYRAMRASGVQARNAGRGPRSMMNPNNSGPGTSRSGM